MTLFYIGLFLLVVMTVLFIAWPLIKGVVFSENSVSDSHLRQSTNVALYHDHRQDIDASLASGSITQEQYDALTTELERNLLEDSAASSQDNSVDVRLDVPKKNSAFIAFFSLLTVGVLIAAALLYGRLGAYSSWQVKQALDNRYALEQAYMAADAQQRPNIEKNIVEANLQLIEQLEVTIEKLPDNLQMRALLGRTAAGMSDYSSAIEQFQAILVLEPELVTIKAELAQALFLQSSNQVLPNVQSLVDDVLMAEPENTIALGLAGIGAFQSADYATAIQYWEQLIAIEGPNTPNSIALQQGIRTARTRMGVSPEDIAISNEVASDEIASSNNAAPSGSTSPRIQVNVTLDERIQSQVSPETTVFIYARAWQGAKVPLAITRITVKDLPADVTLTNAMSMAPSMNLSTSEQFELLARVSINGSPVPQSGDWEAKLGPITALSTGDDAISHLLHITTQIP